ncbi:transcriptional regulator [Colletotrichum tabaci]|uniref:Transcriptional regulator n=1 Tax=Colletotrichum tabaci TaxID=1209068 RepID=A0AAV9TP60_9PEZI
MAVIPSSIIITAATGSVGCRLIPLILSLSHSHPIKLVLPTRNPEHVTELIASTTSSTKPSPYITTAVEQGDIADPVWLGELIALHKVDTVFLNVSGANELTVGLNTFDLCSLPGSSVRHVVYLSMAGDFTARSVVKDGAIRRVRAAHAAVKFALEQFLLYDGHSTDEGMELPFTWTILGPVMSNDNDLRGKQMMLRNGVFPYPLPSGSRPGLPKVDVADIALGAWRAIEDQGRRFHKRKVTIGTREVYRAEETERLWSAALGRQIKSRVATCKEDLDDYELELVDFGKLTPGFARDLRLMMESMGTRFGMRGLTDQEYQLQLDLLGREPRSYEAFVNETAKKWLQEENREPKDRSEFSIRPVDELC